MAKKGQKFNKYSEEFKMEVINYSDKTSIIITSNKYGIPDGTIRTWRRKLKINGTLKTLKQGRPKDEDYKERYEILKKFHDFYKLQKS